MQTCRYDTLVWDYIIGNSLVSRSYLLVLWHCCVIILILL